MSRRSDQRRAAVFALYQLDVTGRGVDDVLERDASTFTRALTYAADDYVADLDAQIERHAHGWSLERIAPVETAKTFCGADAPGFVNGILAAVLREMHENSTTS